MNVVIGILAILRAGAICANVDSVEERKNLTMVSDAQLHSGLVFWTMRPPKERVVSSRGIHPIPSESLAAIVIKESDGDKLEVGITHRHIIDLANQFPASCSSGSAGERHFFAVRDVEDLWLRSLWRPLFLGATAVIHREFDMEPLFFPKAEFFDWDYIHCSGWQLGALWDIAASNGVCLHVIYGKDDRAPRLSRESLGEFGMDRLMGTWSSPEFSFSHTIRTEEEFRGEEGTGHPGAGAFWSRWHVSSNTGGYLNNPAKTSERFVPDPQAGYGGRAYKTEDLFRQGGSRFVEIFESTEKRTDYSREVEWLCGKLPGVELAFMVPQSDKCGSPEISIVLKSSVTDELDVHAACLEINRFFSETKRVRFFESDEIPLDFKGRLLRKKFDTSVLPELSTSQKSLRIVECEKFLLQLWRSAFADDTIGIHDDFFDLGGHSLTAAILIANIREYKDIEFSLELIFNNPSVSQLAKCLVEIIDSNERDS